MFLCGIRMGHWTAWCVSSLPLQLKCMDSSVISVCMSQGENFGVQLCPMDPYRSVCMYVYVCDSQQVITIPFSLFVLVHQPQP